MNDGLHKRREIWHYKLKVEGVWRLFSTHTRKYQDALKVLAQARKDLAENRFPGDSSKLLLSKAAAYWIECRAPLVHPRTLIIDKQRLKPLLLALGNYRLAQIDKRIFREYQARRSATVSNRTINMEAKCLRMILKEHKLWKRLEDDCRDLPENTTGPGRALTMDEEQRLFQAASSKPDWLVAYCTALLAADTSCRSCEIKGLRLKNVDLLNQTIRICRSSTKTDAGERIIPLTTRATTALVKLTERAKLIGATEPDHYLLPYCRYCKKDA
jgi:integrase